MKGRTAKLLKRVHLWLGLGLGLLWLVQGLSGALLVFHRELERGAGPVLSETSVRSPSVLLDAGRRISGRPIDRLNAAGTDSRVIEARYRASDGSRRILMLDAGAASLLAVQDQTPGTPFAGSFWRWLTDLHLHLLAGAVGEALIGLSGLFLLTSLCLGLRLGWPGMRRLRTACAVGTWRGRAQRLYGWHRLIGLLAGLPLLLLAASGAYMAFTQSVASLSGAADPFMARFDEADRMAAGTDQVGADRALAIALRRFPDGRLAQLQTPVERSGQYLVRVRRDCELRRWAGRATVLIDAATGRIMRGYDPCRATVAQRIDDAIYPLHTGEAGGITGRMLAMLSGIALVTLVVLGAMSWMGRRKRKRASNSV